jgi:hypothetical protein
VEVAESGINAEENYVWAKLYGFSTYGPMGDPLSPTPPMVPTISHWGIIAMIAAFIGLLVWIVWRRRPVRS